VEGKFPFVPQKEKKMAKKVVGKIKLQIQAGKANPSPPVVTLSDGYQLCI
jgi:hypothetical protein